MPITIVKKSALPMLGKGKAGSLSVTVSENGQVVLSGLATKFVGDQKIFVGYDNGKVYLIRADSKLVAKADVKDAIELRKAKKGGSASFAGSAILKDAGTFGEKLYDYKASGNQTFAATTDEKNGTLVFELPAGAMIRKPVVKRVKKVKVDAPVANTPVVAEGEELSLEAA